MGSYLLDANRKKTTFSGAGTGRIPAADGSTRLWTQSRGILRVDSVGCFIWREKLIWRRVKGYESWGDLPTSAKEPILASMAEITGTIRIQDGKVVKLTNISDLNVALVHEGDLAKILPELTAAGWKLTGDYTLSITRPAGDTTVHPTSQSRVSIAQFNRSR
jgi:hypothetical protein